MEGFSERYRRARRFRKDVALANEKIDDDDDDCGARVPDRREGRKSEERKRETVVKPPDVIYLLDLAALGLLLRDVLLDGIIEDRLDAKLPQPIQNGSDLHLVLAGDKVAVKGRLHELREERLAQY